jgi:hypothetical protein
VILPSHNARLSAVLSPGSSEDYDVSAGAGSAKWSGDAEALVVEHVLEAVSGEGLDQAKQTHVEIPSNHGVTIKPEDYVTYTPTGASSAVTRRVKEVIAPPLVGVVRVFLWDAPVTLP